MLSLQTSRTVKVAQYILHYYLLVAIRLPKKSFMSLQLFFETLRVSKSSYIVGNQGSEAKSLF